MKMVECKSCGEYIVFLRTDKGGWMPTDVDSVDEGDNEFDHSKHISHFATCEHADQHRKK